VTRGQRTAVRGRLAALLVLLVLTFGAEAQLLEHRRRMMEAPVAAGGGGGVTYLIDENFDGSGAPTSWSGTADFDSASPLIDGTHSLRAESGEYGIFTLATEQSELWYKFRYRIESSLNTVEFLIVYDNGVTKRFSAGVLTTGELWVDAGGGGGFSNTSGTMLPDTDYYIWIRTKKGSGANAEMAASFNTSDSRPTSGSSYVLNSGGSSTADAKYISFTSSGSRTSNFDNVKAAASTFE
jgi:hypothetical protein